MSSPELGLAMLGLIVVAIMMGFPTAFTLMGLGMLFGYVAFWDPAAGWTDNRVFDLFVERTYGVMINDTLLSIPLFVLMGYVMERGALVDRMFYSIQLAFRRVPASLAVATLIVCTFWGIASGLVGAVVVLMGVIAMRPMLKAGYDVKLASGVITAGGTLGILIPPSVMIIVYAAVAGQSVVKLYASAMLPGFFLAFLYLVYIVAWALIDPKIAPRLPEEQLRAPLPPWARGVRGNMLLMLVREALRPASLTRGMATRNFAMALTPLILLAAVLGTTWWYVVIHKQAEIRERNAAADLVVSAPKAAPAAPATADADKPRELGAEQEASGEDAGALLSAPGAEAEAEADDTGAPSSDFYYWFWGTVAGCALLLLYYYARLDAEAFVILDLLTRSVMPLGVLTLLVLAVILFGITTATESAGIGAAGAFVLALHARTLTFAKTKEAIYLTAKTTTMIGWLFLGSGVFSAVFALHGGQRLLEKWVLAMNLSPVQFMILSQAIIFLLGWPLEWTEIIVIFVPIFLPMLSHFQIDPILWGTLVFVNLQAAFLSPPVAMSAFYLKGVSPPHVTLNQIFAGMMPYMLIVILCMVFMYLWPGMSLWLPEYLYGK
jgi:TRAP-type mannitol/chloroaromatic compound transport system permease large subunit